MIEIISRFDERFSRGSSDEVASAEAASKDQPTHWIALSGLAEADSRQISS